MIIEPDQLLYENGKYFWTRERMNANWETCFGVLEEALRSGTVRRVVMLVGLPGSGKSTWAQSADAPDTVIFDGFFGFPHRRERLLKLAKSYGVPVEAAWVTTDLETCLARNAQRSEDRRVPEETIRVMANQLSLTPPMLEEGFAKLDRISGEGPVQPTETKPGPDSGV
jgi:predicted kinase